MAINMKMQFDVSRTRKLFSKLPKNIKKEIGTAMFKIARNKRDGLRYQLRNVSKKWRNEIYRGINARKISNNQSIVVIPQKGVWLDSMRPHFVPFHPMWDITEWAKSKGFNTDRMAGVFVRPHPFILKGLARGDKNKDKIYNEAMKLAIKNSRS